MHVRWSSDPAAATAARYSVTHAGGVSVTEVDQTQNGGHWQALGVFQMSPGAGHTVSLSTTMAGYRLMADAVKFEPISTGEMPRVVADAVKFVPKVAEDVLYVHPDHLGSPQKMTDGTGAVVWDAAFTPFGEEAAISGAATNNQRFPGQYFDAETGLHQNWMRDYDPSIGRYVQSDPIGLEGGLNSYAYAEENPIRRVDPWGESTAIWSNLLWDWPSINGLKLPDKPRRGWSCNARCSTIPAACPPPDCPAVLLGSGTGNSLSEAKNAARTDANRKVPSGCSLKHCTYACQSNKKQWRSR